MHTRQKSILLAILSCIIWSMAFAALKIGLRYVGPLFLAGLRFSIAGVLVLTLAGNKSVNLKLAWQHRKTILIISFFQTFGLYTLFHLGISMVSASVTALVIGAGPLFIAILASLINNEPLTGKKLVAIIVGFAGIAVIALARFGGLLHSEVATLGIVILLLANISGSFGNVYISKNRLPVHPIFQNGLQQLIGGLGILILSFFTEDIQLVGQPPEFYAALLWLSLIAASGFSIWFVVLNMPGVKVSEINVWKFIIPVLGAGLSWILLPDDKPEPFVLAGMLLVAMSLVVMFWRK